VTKQKKIQAKAHQIIEANLLICGGIPLLTLKGLEELFTYLHSQGVVIKVDRELPKYPYPLVTQVTGGMEVVDTWQKIYDETQQGMLEVGYVAVEPIIKEVKE